MEQAGMVIYMVVHVCWSGLRAWFPGRVWWNLAAVCMWGSWAGAGAGAAGSTALAPPRELLGDSPSLWARK